MGPQSTIYPNLPRRAPLRNALALLLALTSIPGHPQVPATSIPLALPSAIVFDPQGNLYLAETANHVIRKVDTTGHITTVAGTGTQGSAGENVPATSADLDSPQGLSPRLRKQPLHSRHPQPLHSQSRHHWPNHHHRRHPLPRLRRRQRPRNHRSPPSPNRPRTGLRKQPLHSRHGQPSHP